MKTALVRNECFDLKYKRKPLFDKDSKDSSIQECSDCRTDNWEIIRHIKNDLRDNLSFILCFVQSIERKFPFMTDRFSSDKLEHQHANSSGFLHYCLSSYFQETVFIIFDLLIVVERPIGILSVRVATRCRWRHWILIYTPRKRQLLSEGFFFVLAPSVTRDLIKTQISINLP